MTVLFIHLAQTLKNNILRLAETCEGEPFLLFSASYQLGCLLILQYV